MDEFKNIWGRGGLAEERAGLRNQLLQQAVDRGNPANAEPDSIIGGQYIEGGDVAGLKEATAGLRDREATVRATRMANFGSNQLNPYASPRVGNNGTTSFGDSTTSQNGGSPSFGDSTTSQNGGSPSLGVPLRSKRNQLGSSGGYLDSLGGLDFNKPFDPNTGFRNGGMVDKQRMMKQPGYQGGGKVKMPGDWPNRPYGRDDLPAYDNFVSGWHPPNEAAREAIRATPEYQQAITELTAAGWKPNPRFANDDLDAVDKWIAQQNMDAGKGGFKNGGAVCKRSKGMRGYAMGGAVGDEMEDDGRDTVDVRVREGEYLLNPETVAYFGQGDYDAGVDTLDGIVEQATGEEPGPVPVNEEGEAVRGFRNGGKVKMGYAAGGSFVVMPDGTRIEMTEASNRRFAGQPLSAEGAASQRPGGMGTTTTARPIEGPARPSNARMAGRRVADAAGRTVRGVRNFAASDANTKPLRTIGRGAQTVLSKIPGSRVLNIPGALAFGTGTMVGDAAYEAGIETGADWIDTVGGTINNIGLRSGLFGDPNAEVGIAEGNRIAEQFEGGTAAEQGITAPPTEAPAAYGRAFGAGDVTLPSNGLRSASEAVAPGGMNVVQRTGGPGDEVIVREDVNGVPTFTNLRQGGFDGSARNLQAEADARVQQDTARERQQLALQRERLASATPESSANVLAAQAKGGGQGKAQEAVTKEIRARFTQPKYDDEGNLTGSTEDVEAERVFMDAMTQMVDPSTGQTYAALLPNMAPAERAALYEQFDSIYSDTRLANQAAMAQGFMPSDQPRGGENALRVMPGSDDIRFWDVPTAKATFGDWWAGLGNDSPLLNKYIEDPRTKAQIPARRAVRTMEDARRFGLLEE